MAFRHKKSAKFFQNKVQESNNVTATVIKKPTAEETSASGEEEYEVVECVIRPEKIICPDCGGITLQGLDYCNKCGGELTINE